MHKVGNSQLNTIAALQQWNYQKPSCSITRLLGNIDQSGVLKCLDIIMGVIKWWVMLSANQCYHLSANSIALQANPIYEYKYVQVTIILV